MDESERRRRVHSFLEENRLGGPGLRIDEPRNRQYSTAYPVELRSGQGDARLEVFVYDLTDDPAGVVDAEEERIALAELDSPLVPDLLADRSDPDLVLLAVAYPRDVERLRSAPEESGHETALVYQPDIDRLLGADGFRELDGTVVFDSLMSRHRAEALIEILGRLTDSVGADTAEPRVPTLLAAYEVEPMPIRSRGDVPAEYATLVLVTTLVSPYLALDKLEQTLDPEQAADLAERLFDTVRAGHRLPATFCRAGGCCLRPEFVLPTGDLADAYFLTAGEDYDASSLAELQVRDLFNALDTILSLDLPAETRSSILAASIGAYTGRPVVPPLTEIVAAVAGGSRDVLAALAAATHHLGAGPPTLRG